MVLLICVAFAGQAMASTIMSYHMMSMKGMNGQEQSQDMSMMDHSNHNMTSDSSDDLDKSEDDCCTQTCSCFTGSCSSIATFTKHALGNVLIIELSSKIFSSSSLVLSQQPTSLYRPPILS
ncbi:hypothetical protein [Colwellia hornerae]|uniref:CopL family metal-binding regulatory protein n=1 Tax=Colwellia hornerae TaxID=89402 RepID=A0A5C6QMY3_9GAMM|nr:hypothetical protein [Colwellia hornerae]TWX54631.1 hypothetical protein ESZ28_07930 [Colwellia hornerae]TWX61071.1 hypothetical protein ESZ26_06705 [Colwellia hornerae]TWX70324.1 hypothetical protein ESZ27_04195 [Colwellia hornerae]